MGEVGLGWENKYTSVHMHKPEYQPIIAYPVAWSRGTDGKVVSNVVFVNTSELYSEDDLNKFRGKLRDKIVLTAPKRKLELQFNPLAIRFSEEYLEQMAELKIGGIEGGQSQQRESDYEKRPLSQEEVELFFEAEGVAALIEPGTGGTNGHFDKGVVNVGSGGLIGVGDRKPLPRLIIAAEHYNRMMRILEKGIDVEMEVNVEIEYDENDLVDYNVIAEIPGTELQDEIVMIGGHYDAESSGTGATDNASGAAGGYGSDAHSQKDRRAATPNHPRRTLGL